MHLFPKTHFDFVGARWMFFTFSTVLLGGSLVLLATRGVKYGIDFTGGTVIQLSFDKPIELSALRDAVERGGTGNASLQSFSGTNSYALRLPTEASQTAEEIEHKLTRIQAALPENKFTVDRKEFVGPAIGKHLLRQALWAVALSLAGIIVFLGFRFSNPIWGVAGIVALVHDVIATLGLFSLIGAEVDLLIVSALLTIGGYSIHDSIIIFDRMREKLRLMRRDPLRQVVNESMNETLSRTIITSGLVFGVVVILYISGGKVIHHFALAMVFGTLVGTYSSIAVAAPLVFEWLTRHSSGRSSAPALSIKSNPSNEKNKRLQA